MLGLQFDRTSARRALALVACAAILYFAVGGSLLHQHTSGADNACHICQALHMPALAACSVHLLPAPELVIRYASLPDRVSPNSSFSLHRAGRAPPSV
ncbi:MAG TPA: hypothetical protein VK525_19495 [Candidatus Saccharimonadales bacterium]|nr:hypothetical protein [Candidatus Saccharimonadales bacterium]